MKTVLTRSATEAAAFIRRGGIVGFPTETVYGLGAAVFDEATIRKIFDAKKRPADNPLIAHVSSVDQIAGLVLEIPAVAQKLIEAFFPGPLTLVLRKSARVPLLATAGLETIGVRMPRLVIANEFLTACGVPLVAPSANLSGRPSPTTWQAVSEDLDGRIDCILQGDPTEIGLESTVVDCTTDPPVLLRQGAISRESLSAIVPAIRVSAFDEADAPRSPGLKHKHYSPRARVVVVDANAAFSATAGDAFIGLNAPATKLKITKLCNSVEEYAGSLFEFFRECDRSRVNRIFCESVVEDGLGAALMDRVRRAAVSD
ncbi:MAG: L-threonylcarbamoyladenylate synthase [Acidobacteriota bacterium]